MQITTWYIAKIKNYFSFIIKAFVPLSYFFQFYISLYTYWVYFEQYELWYILWEWVYENIFFQFISLNTSDPRKSLQKKEFPKIYWKRSDSF